MVEKIMVNQATDFIIRVTTPLSYLILMEIILRLYIMVKVNVMSLQ